jgi:hypothetical protein
VSVPSGKSATLSTRLELILASAPAKSPSEQETIRQSNDVNSKCQGTHLALRSVMSSPQAAVATELSYATLYSKGALLVSAAQLCQVWLLACSTRLMPFGQLSPAHKRCQSNMIQGRLTGAEKKMSKHIDEHNQFSGPSNIKISSATSYLLHC